MYFGFTESESFNDPTILNNYKHYNVVVEKRSDGKGYWHIFILDIDDEYISQTVMDISSALKSDWNAIFFNDATVYCLFKDKIFTLNKKENWNLSDYQDVKDYAKKCDVGNLDMNDVFNHYKKLLGDKFI